MVQLAYRIDSALHSIERRIRAASWVVRGHLLTMTPYDYGVSGWSGWLDAPDGRLLAFVRDDGSLQFSW